jgi:hypothetical protein
MGRVQRGILATLDERPPLTEEGQLNAIALDQLAASVYPDAGSFSRAQLEAVRRAALGLCDLGRVEIWREERLRPHATSSDGTSRREIMLFTRPLTADEERRHEAWCERDHELFAAQLREIGRIMSQSSA